MRKSRSISLLAAFVAMFVVANATSYETGAGAPSFVNYETPHVSPISMTPDGTKLLVVNTADNRIEVFNLIGRLLTSIGSVPVGLEPVSVRARSNGEAWVVNHLSDSVSVVNLNTLTVIRTLTTADEPEDVVFAGTPEKAFVSCSQPSKVLVFDTANLATPPTEIVIEGKDPRMMTVSPARDKVYVAIFNSGNQSTILGSHGGNPTTNIDSPYGGVSPPPNDGVDFNPPVNPELPPAEKLGLIVKKDAGGLWMDDNQGDWTEWVTGSKATRSGRVQGWFLVDNDVAEITVSTTAVRYYTGMMNLVMAIGVTPSGGLTAVGTEATNEIRFEPNVNGRFLRVNLAIGNSGALSAPRIVDMNPHLDYSDAQIAQQNDPATFSNSLNERSIGDPRAIVWSTDGNRAYVAGMGSNNVIEIDARGKRTVSPMVVGAGPTGLALDAARKRLYVLNRFDASISVIDTRRRTELQRVSFFDPAPAAVKTGRPFLYDTHLTSGLGHISCASCHVDARTDRIAWDLGNPAGTMTTNTNNCGYGMEGEGKCKAYHPMKAPMLTQTLQDIIGHEPHHWRGDKKGLEEFNPAFTNLQGAPAQLSAGDMQAFEDFLATIHFPPNPHRNLDNSLPTSLSLDGHFATGLAGLPVGAPLPPGNAVTGLNNFRFVPMHVSGPGGGAGREMVRCVMCHTLPTGMGADVQYSGSDPRNFPFGSGEYVDIAAGPDGERHLMITGLPFGGADENHTFKVPQLRNLYTRTGIQSSQQKSLTGFGFFHDGSNTLSVFLNRFPGIVTDQDAADMIAFLLSFSGSDLPVGSHSNLLEPPGPTSKDAHAAVGAQITFDQRNKNDLALIDRLGAFLALADAGSIGVVAKGRRDGVQRGYVYIGGDTFLPDRSADPVVSTSSLRLASDVGAEITFTVVPRGSETRIGVDRDQDGTLDGNE